MIKYVVIGGAACLILLSLIAVIAWSLGRIQKTTFTKLMVGFLLANGAVWVYLSYVLAYLGRVEIAEALSRAVVVEILGVVLIYGLKSLTENLSKNNAWPDKTQKSVKKEEVTTYEQP